MSGIRSLDQNQLDQAISDLRAKYADAKVEASETRKVLSDCIESLGGLFGKQTATAQPRDWWFFRVRTASGFDSEALMLEPSQYSYPPAGSCRSMGRCHVAGHPVFYGSDSYDGAIREMKSPEEENYLVAAWRLPARSITRLNFLYSKNISAHRLIEIKNKALADAFEQHGFSDELNRSRMRAHMVAWSDLFLSGAEYYALTASIAHQCIYNSFAGTTDLVAYGSALDGSYANYAIHPNLADELKLYRIYACRVAKPNDNPVSFLRYTERQPDGKLIWQEMNKGALPVNDPTMPTTIEPPPN